MNRPPLNKGQLTLYGIPGLPLAMLGLPLFVYLPTFYSETLGLSLSAVGLALLFARFLDVITDPLIGLFNDRLHSKKWKRKSFILIGLPILFIGSNYLLRAGAGVTTFYLFVWSFITYLGWTLVNIPWVAWGVELSHGYHEKSRLASSREIFAMVGTVFVIALPVFISTENNLKQNLIIISDALNILLPLCIIPLLWFLPETSHGQLVNKRKIAWANLSKIITSNQKLRTLLPIYFVNNLANAFPATLFILFVSQVLNTPEKTNILLISYFLAAVIGLPFWLYIAKRTDKHKSWGIALIVAIMSFMFVPFLSEKDFLAFLVICLVSGFALGADIVLPSSIQADIAQDISEKEHNSSGLLFGVWGLLTKLSLAIGIGIAFPVLDFFGLNSANQEQSSSSGILSLSLLYGAAPVFLKLWVVFKVWNFPFNKQHFVSKTILHTTGEQP